MKNVAKQLGTILGSVFITLLLVAVGGFFGLPILYPNLNADLDNYIEDGDLTDEGILLQTKYFEVQTNFAIGDTEFDAIKIPDTEVNITTTGNSKLSVAFEGAFYLLLSSAFEGYAVYNITLDIAGVDQRATRIEFFEEISSGSACQIPCNLHISFETGILPAGTYEISVYWKSIVSPAAGTSNLCGVPGAPRSIYIQEIAG